MAQPRLLQSQNVSQRADVISALFCKLPYIPEKIVFFNRMAIMQGFFRKNFAMMKNRLKLDLNN